MKRYFKQMIAMLTVFAMFFTVLGSAQASTSSNGNLTENQVKELEELFHAIEIMPDSVIAQGPETIVNFIDENTSDDIQVQQQGEFVTFGVVGCVSAFGLAILTNAIPFTKIAKVKDAVKAAGGATTFVRTLISTYNTARDDGSSVGNAIQQGVNAAASAAGPEARRALLDLFNLGNVYSACFE